MKRHLITLLILITFITLKAQIIDTLLDVGGYDLHFRIVRGEGTPILFESGGGDDCSIWSDGFIDSISHQTGATIITYSRSGFGKSGVKKHDINILDEIIGLEHDLKQLGYSDKYFLVAHSYGGFLSNILSFRNPQAVIGYVAIDAINPCIFHEGRIEIMNDQFLPIKDSLRVANIGLYNLALSIEEDVKIMKESPMPEHIPIINIVAEKQFMDSATVMDCHKSYVSLSDKREMIVAKNCGHYTFLDNPQLIIDNISDLYRDNSVREFR